MRYFHGALTEGEEEVAVDIESGLWVMLISTRTQTKRRIEEVLCWRVPMDRAGALLLSRAKEEVDDLGCSILGLCWKSDRERGRELIMGEGKLSSSYSLVLLDSSLILTFLV